MAGLLSFIPVLAPICGPIALAAGGAALLMDAALAASGNGSWKMLAVDGVLMALPGAGKLAARSLRNARGTTTAARISQGAQRRGVPRKIARQWGRRIEQGNKFDVTRSRHHTVNQLRLANNKVLDSYEPDLLIISRKHTQLAKVRPETARGYLNEAANKYSPGEVIADTAANRARYPELVGEKLSGNLVLQVPKQKAPIPSSVLDHADQLDIEIHQVSDFAGFPVGPPVSQVGETAELVDR